MAFQLSLHGVFQLTWSKIRGVMFGYFLVTRAIYNIKDKVLTEKEVGWYTNLGLSTSHLSISITHLMYHHTQDACQEYALH